MRALGVLLVSLLVSFSALAEVHIHESRVQTTAGEVYTLASTPQPLAKISELDFFSLRSEFREFKVQVIVGKPEQQDEADSIVNSLNLPTGFSAEMVNLNRSAPVASAAKEYRAFNHTENWMFATIMTTYMGAAAFSVWIFAKDADPQTAAAMAALYSAPVFYMTLGLRTFDRLFRKAAEKLKFGPQHMRETGARMSVNLLHAELYVFWMYLFAKGLPLNDLSVQGDILTTILTTSVGGAYLDSIRAYYFKSSQSKWFNFTVFALLSPLILADLSGMRFLSFDFLSTQISIPTVALVVSAQVTAAQLLQRSQRVRNAVRRFTIAEHIAFKKFFRKAKASCQSLLSSGQSLVTTRMSAYPSFE